MPSERHPDWLVADGLPAQVRGLMATRAGGVSQGACQGLNLRPNELPRATEGLGLTEACTRLVCTGEVCVHPGRIPEVRA